MTKQSHASKVRRLPRFTSALRLLGFGGQIVKLAMTPNF